jgi:hypothetical protein
LNDNELPFENLKEKVMTKFILPALAAATLALSASSAFAHGHLVTGAELYATPAPVVAPAAQDQATAHKTRVIAHKHIAPANTAS